MSEKIYIGKLKEKATGQGYNGLKGFICKDDIMQHADKIQKGGDGKEYIPIFIYPRLKPDNRGNTHTIIIDVKDDITPSTEPIAAFPSQSQTTEEEIYKDDIKQSEEGWNKNPLASEE